ERPCADDDDVGLLGSRHQASERQSGAGFEERAARYRRRASRTARRTASRSASGSGGPQGSSQASSGITPSAASAQSIRRIYPSTGAANVVEPKASSRDVKRKNVSYSRLRQPMSSCACKS